MKSKSLMFIWFTYLSIHLAYGQNETDFNYVKLDSIEFTHKPIFEEIQKMSFLSWNQKDMTQKNI